MEEEMERKTMPTPDKAQDAPRPTVTITYCTRCGWLLRAAWMAQELLTTFSEEIGALTLVPDATGGVFEVQVEGETVWSRERDGGFPDIKVLKQRVRDRVAPGRDLGHSDAPDGRDRGRLDDA